GVLSDALRDGDVRRDEGFVFGYPLDHVHETDGVVARAERKGEFLCVERATPHAGGDAGDAEERGERLGGRADVAEEAHFPRPISGGSMKPTSPGFPRSGGSMNPRSAPGGSAMRSRSAVIASARPAAWARWPAA